MIRKFSKLSTNEKFNQLIKLKILTKNDVHYLQHGGIQNIKLANQFIENCIGYFQLPLGVATNLRIDKKNYVIPLAVEETSIVASLSKTAKWINKYGKITTWIDGKYTIGQIQLSKLKNFYNFKKIILNNKKFLINKINREILYNMKNRGGGAKNLEIRTLKRKDGNNMAIIHVMFDTCNAMGANIINQVLEFLKKPIEELTAEKISLCIVSNFNDKKITNSKILIKNVNHDLGTKLQESSLFAEIDPYRAATHNKGIMNGIDPVAIATGNDWRAIESGIHSYAARDGHYKPISSWRYRNGILQGRLSAPIIVGTVGGMTALHPTAQLCLRIMRIQSSDHLSRILAAVGLVQNLGSLIALNTKGIIHGHMKLHINNIIVATKALYNEIPILKKYLIKRINSKKYISLNNTKKFLYYIRQTKKYDKKLENSC